MKPLHWYGNRTAHACPRPQPGGGKVPTDLRELQVEAAHLGAIETDVAGDPPAVQGDQFADDLGEVEPSFDGHIGEVKCGEAARGKADGAGVGAAEADRAVEGAAGGDELAVEHGGAQVHTG